MKDQSNSYRLPILSFVGIPLAILLTIFLLYTFLTGCLTETDVYKDLSSVKSEVLGVKSFDLSASNTKVKDGETVTYTLQLATDNQNVGAVTSTVVFNLAGEGRMGTNIEGPGLCIRTTELRATCTAVNLPANSTIAWKVPVTAKATCSQSATPTLTMIATNGAVGIAPATSEDTAIATCINGGNGGAPSPTSSTTNGGTGNNGTGGSSSTIGNKGNLNSQDVFAIVKQHNSEVLACFTSKIMYTFGAVAIVWIIALLMYFLGSGKRRSKKS